MLTIEEVEKIMAEHPFLPKPKYLYLIKAKVIGIVDSTILEFKGATPKQLRDRIAITADADDVTIVHECLHLAGFGELGAYVLAPIIRAFRKAFPPLIKSEVKYKFVGSPKPNVEVYEGI